MAKDYYKILGVGRSASDEEIKKAYRKLAHQHHPDKSGGDERKFKEVSEAYQVLSNKEKRSQYDRFGQIFEGGGGAPPPGWEHFGGSGPGGNAQWNVNFNDLGDFSDIFESIFDQFGGGSGFRRRPTYTRGADLEISLEITLEEAFSGISKTVPVRAHVPCKSCSGLGYHKEKGTKSCSTCQGRGEIREQRQTFFGNFSQIRGCPECHGRGELPESSCKACGGLGRTSGTRDVAVAVAPGVEDGQIIKISNMGEAGERGSATGDLYVVLRVKEHSVFKRKKNDLFLEEEIGIGEALLGKKIPMRDLSGEEFSVSVPGGFNLKDLLKVPARGMPRLGLFGGKSERGDLYISFNLKLPKKLSSRAKKLLEELDEEL